jgi:hypothetical protein
MRIAIISLALCIGCSHELRAPEEHGNEQPGAESERTAPSAAEHESAPERGEDRSDPSPGSTATIDGGVADGGVTDAAPDAAPAAQPDRADAGDAGEGGAPGERWDALSADAGWYLTSPRCPEEVLPMRQGSGAADRIPGYPITYVEVIRGAEGLPTTAFSARWTGLRKLATAKVRPCLPAFVTNPPGLPCQVETVLELTTSSGSRIEILLGLPHDDLARFADGRGVSVLIGPAQGAPGSPPPPYGPLEIRDSEGGTLLVAVAMSEGFAGPKSLQLSGWSWDEMMLSFDQLHCVAERDSCLRVFVSRKLTAAAKGAAATQLDPGQSATLSSKGHSYRVTYRSGIERAYGVFSRECADLGPGPSYAAELIQLP